jgi:hypothetical protein
MNTGLRHTLMRRRSAYHLTRRLVILTTKGNYQIHVTLKIFNVTRIWSACVKFHNVDNTQFEFLFSAGCVTVQTIVITIWCVRLVQL